MNDDLPPLPQYDYGDYDFDEDRFIEAYTTEKMREYAKKAVEADRALRPTSGEYAQGYAEGFNDACKPTPLTENPKKRWVGLTDAEITEAHDPFMGNIERARALEAKLKEKNT